MRTISELEKELERKFVKAIIQAGGWPLKFISPGAAGVPDRIVLKPQGKAFFAEIKRPGEGLRKLQKHRARQLAAYGFKTYVINSEQRIRDVVALEFLDGGD